MASTSSSGTAFRPSPAFIALGLFLIVLWLAGGASRDDVTGQVVVRGAAALTLLVAILLGRRPCMQNVRPVWIVLGAAVAIGVCQLLPLPAWTGQALPGREFLGAAGQDWQGWSLVPGATFNALFALLVPLAVLVSATMLDRNEMEWLPAIVLGMAAASMLLGLLQFSGVGIDSPLVNDSPGVVSGTFANRNHFALFIALGCLLVPVWMFREGRRSRWRGPVGLGLLLLFTLTVLASGSRAGMLVCGLAIVIAGAMSWRGLRRELRHAPRWALPAVVAAVVAVLASFILVSVAADRAVSIQRSLSVDVQQDMRTRAFPTVWSMTRATFPAGNGLGSFEPMFRVHEPLDLLKPTYFNQAHDDLVEVVLDAGLPGLLLLAVVLVMWSRLSIRAWRRSAQQASMLPRLGSAMLLLVLVASVFDYPARTPMMMAMIVLAAVWLSDRSDAQRVSALPGSGHHL